MNRYDYIIAGAGCAGLSLAYQLLQTPLREKSILLIDREPKTQNDRTWCFWEAGKNAFDSVVCRQWQQMQFHGENFSAALDLGNYRYKMIRSADFYRFAQNALADQPNVDLVYGEISGLQNSANGAEVTVNGKTYQADWAFSSLYHWEKQPIRKGYHYLLQHFMGWEVQTLSPFFNPEQATLMDFRIDQHGQTRFVYVLPVDERRALVEFTVFSEALLPEADYKAELQHYLRQYLQLPTYKVIHQEFGVIPMNDHPFASQTGERIMHIGTAGGQTKPSSGYTFRRIQQQTQAIVQALLTTGKPLINQPAASRFNLYDSMLLNIMAKKRHATKDIFTHLFQRNQTETILKFLDEQTSFAEDLQIMASVPATPFLMALADVLAGKLRILKK